MPTLFTALKAHADIQTLQKEQPLKFAVGDLGSSLAAAGKGAHLKSFKAVEHATSDVPNPLLSLRDRFSILKKPNPQAHIIVVGAGFAGLAAAYELESVGYRVSVIEAQATVGGRVESRNDIVPGKVMEGGAELIGRNHLAWWSYKYKFDLKLNLLPSSSNPPPVILGGKRLSSKEAAQVGREMDRVRKAISKAARNINAAEPWSSTDASRLDRMSLVDGLKTIPMSDLCRLAFVELLQTDNGVPANRQSWLGNLAMIKGGGLDKYWTDTETHHCEGGNQKLAFAFRDALQTVLLGRSVKSIDIQKAEVAVTLSNGRIVRGSDVVLATPPTMWRKMSITPALPKAYQVQFGRNVKYLLDVGAESWNPDSPESSSDGPIDLTWEGTESGGTRAGFVAFSGADDADVCRLWPSKKQKYLRVLSTLYPNLRSTAQTGRFFDWPSARWSLGSYSFPQPGEVIRVGPRLRNGFKQVLHFAGEHTCYAFTGYMEGSLQSALRVSQQIARRDGIIA